MASEAAQAVAKDVLTSVRKGLIPNKGEIIKERGYSVSVSKKPKKVTETKSYKDVIYPVVQRLEEERQRAIEALPKLIGKAKYRDAIDAIDKLTKNHQLLTGGATANVAIGVKKLSDAELEALTEPK